MTKLAASLLLLHQLMLPTMGVSGSSSHLRRQQAITFMDEPLAAGEDEEFWSGMMRQMASSMMTDAPTTAPTGCMTEIKTRDDIIDILSSISDPALMRQAGTPQNKAVEFLHDYPSVDSCAQAKFWHQRYALAVLYYSMTNGTSNNLINWLDGDKSVCEWVEPWEEDKVVQTLISCDNGNNVIQLDFSDGLEVEGTIPSELQGLSSLEYLFFLQAPNGGFHGTIPSELGTLDQLKTFVLTGNPLLEGSIPSELGDLQSCTMLSVADNPSLHGTIPSELLHVNSPLRTVNLQGNGLEGTIPTEFGNLSALSVLQLSRNELSGTIPTELGSVDSLRWLYLDNNLLSGDIPTELGNLDIMERLRLQGSDMTLTSTIPKEICSVALLDELFTSFCSDKSVCCAAPFISA